MKENIVTQNESNVVSASFQQKSAGISLFIIGSTAIYYFVRMWPMRPIALAGTPIPPGYGALVISALGFVILAEIVLQIVLIIGAGTASKATMNEQNAVLKAARNANGVLVAGVLGVLGLLFLGFPAFCLANLALLALFAAEITKFASQMIYAKNAK